MIILIPQRDWIIPKGQVPGAPKELSLEDADRLREKRETKSAEHRQSIRQRPEKRIAPWAKWKNKS